MELFDYLTFPSYNNAIFRTKYMAKDAIVLLPPEGFHRENRRSSCQAMGETLYLLPHVTPNKTELLSSSMALYETGGEGAEWGAVCRVSPRSLWLRSRHRWLSCGRLGRGL
jgi:hypothetical protein